MCTGPVMAHYPVASGSLASRLVARSSAAASGPAVSVSVLAGFPEPGVGLLTLLPCPTPQPCVDVAHEMRLRRGTRVYHLGWSVRMIG